MQNGHDELSVIQAMAVQSFTQKLWKQVSNFRDFTGPSQLAIIECAGAIEFHPTDGRDDCPLYLKCRESNVAILDHFIRFLRLVHEESERHSQEYQELERSLLRDAATGKDGEASGQEEA